jgi:hypothetical protein
MRNKQVVFLFYSLLFVFNIEAQKNSNYLKVSGGTEIPTGFFSESYKVGLGAHVTDYFDVGRGGSILLSTGLSSWKASKVDIKAGLF